MTIAVLALQGAFIEHENMLRKLGAETFEIRQKRDLDRPFDGLIIPGGESTVQGLLLRKLGLLEPLKEKITKGLPVFGTCAGLILLSKRIENDTRSHFASMDIETTRNAYGKQLGSFAADAAFEGIGVVPMTFIRAPYIRNVFGRAKALARVDGRIVAARQDNQLVTSFHPELGGSTAVHEYFLNMVSSYRDHLE